MAAKRPQHRQPPPTSGGQTSVPSLSPLGLPRWTGPLLGHLTGTVLGPFIRLFAAGFLGVAAVLLVLAWQTGPQRLVDAARYAPLTARQAGKVVESWLALEWDPAEMGESLRWRAFAKASPCVIVEYTGDWGSPARRAFCGNRFKFLENYTLHNLWEMAPGVPFTWRRDARGFILPEVRLSAASRQWLAAHSPELPYVTEASTAIEALRRELDRPVDDAVASWSVPAADFPLVFDPSHPAEAWPAGFVEKRRALRPEWIFVVLLGAAGLYLWFQGLTVLFGRLPLAALCIVAILPLVTLPWWAEQFPRGLRALNQDVAGVIADMLGDLDPTSRLIASDPAHATLAGGDRLAWTVGDGPYADTFGRFRYALPDPPPGSPDAALAALAETVATQARTLGEAERIQIFHRLRQDKESGLAGAGFIFLPAAKEAVLDPRSSPALKNTAARFLSAWVTQPVEDPYPSDLGFRERVRLYRDLTEMPVVEIATPAGWIVERAEKRK